MKVRQWLTAIWIIIFLFSHSLLPAQESFEECTAGVASGRATTDGRPLLWKSRDADAPDNKIIWNTTGKYHFVSVITAGQPESSWMGANEKGFSIINTLSSDLTRGKTGPHNGIFMAIALRECATVDEFEELLKRTNVSGRTTNTNYGVIDAMGAAAFFETAGHEYWKFDTEDTEHGYILRTNFAENGKREEGKEPYSIDRFIRTTTMMEEFYSTDKIDFEEITRVQVRNFGDRAGAEVKIPFRESWAGHTYGFFPNTNSICRNSTVSFSVIQGILPGEAAELTTMWTILGQPAMGILVPYWPVGETPVEVNGPETAPLCDAANDIRSVVYGYFAPRTMRSGRILPLYIDTYKLRGENSEGIWRILFPAEDAIIREAEAALNRWRRGGPDRPEMLELESILAKKALVVTREAYQYLLINANN